MPDLTERMEKLGIKHFADSLCWAQILPSCPNHRVCPPCPTAPCSHLQPSSGMCWVHPLCCAPMHTTPPINFLACEEPINLSCEIISAFSPCRLAVSSRKSSGKWAPPKGLSSALSQKGKRDTEISSRCAPPPGETVGYSAKSRNHQ